MNVEQKSDQNEKAKKEKKAYWRFKVRVHLESIWLGQVTGHDEHNAHHKVGDGEENENGEQNVPDKRPDARECGHFFGGFGGSPWAISRKRAKKNSVF